jgi:hypothetical protein
MAYLILFGMIAILWLPMMIDRFRHVTASAEERAAREIWQRDQKLAGRTDAGTYGAFGADGGAGSCGGDGGGSCS